MNTIIKLFIGLFFVIFAITASAETVTIDGLKYDLNSDATASVAQQDQTIAGEIMIPSTVEYGGLTYQVATVGKKAFDNCKKITSVIISNNITLLQEQCFGYCDNLIKVTLPSTVKSLEPNCFVSCVHLNDINIPQSLTSIGSYCFFDCGLESLTIPKGVTSIETMAFSRCPLNSMLVEEGNPNYDSRDNCNAIINTETNEMVVGCKNTIIPSTVTSLAKGCFQGTSFSSESIEIPDNITSLGGSCFELSNLKQITLPKNLTQIDDHCFYLCSSLSSVTCLNTTPPTLGECAFMVEVGFECDLYVPEVAINAYKSTPVWRDFNIRPMSSSGINTINTDSTTNNGKIVRDGQVIIVHNGMMYNTFGQPIK